MNKQQLFILLLFGFIILVVGGLLWLPSKPVTTNDRFTVVTSFYPLAEFTKQVGGDLIEVVTTTPAGIEPHDFEPSSQAIVSISGADLFIYNGGGVDAWATKLMSGMQEVPSLNMSGYLSNKLTGVDQSSEEDVFDEHFWLSPMLAQQQVVVIRDTLMVMDPANAEIYRTNADVFLEQLNKLDQDYRAGLAQCDLRVAVTSHAAFAYLARDYQFEQIPITGLSPDEEPSAGDLAIIAEEARARNVKYIFFETLVSPKLAETLAREVGAVIIVFNPLEGLTEKEQSQGKTYLSVMRENLHNLRTAMSCQ